MSSPLAASRAASSRTHCRRGRCRGRAARDRADGRPRPPRRRRRSSSAGRPLAERLSALARTDAVRRRSPHRRSRALPRGPVVTPFGGAEHDWSAIELAAWLAASLRHVAPPARHRGRPGGRDGATPAGCWRAPRCSCSRSSGSSRSRVLIEPGDARRRQASADARCSSSASPIAGARRESAPFGRPSPRRRRTGPVRSRRPSPGGLAPSQTMTRFTWTQAAAPAPVSQ